MGGTILTTVTLFLKPIDPALWEGCKATMIEIAAQAGGKATFNGLEVAVEFEDEIKAAVFAAWWAKATSKQIEFEDEAKAIAAFAALWAEQMGKSN
jgi:hypothetical protein